LGELGRLSVMLFDIVVAHYKENLGWLSQLVHENIRQINLYTKDSLLSFDPRSINNKISHKYLSNIGRESDTYLKYCLEFRDNLPNFVFFLQGNPFIHGINTNHILGWINNLNEQDKFTPTFRDCPLNYATQNGRVPHWGSATIPNSLNIDEWFKKFINKDHDVNRCKVCFGANFGVSKDRILSRPTEDYKLLLDDLNNINPESGHYMERSWFYFFNLDKIL
jgi:hypothetical protein